MVICLLNLVTRPDTTGSPVVVEGLLKIGTFPTKALVDLSPSPLLLAALAARRYMMAKSMALIENGTIVNMLWCSDSQPETESLINPADRPVAIGDTYSDGKFYRDGVEILTPLEEALKTNAEYESALSEIETALGVNA